MCASITTAESNERKHILALGIQARSGETLDQRVTFYRSLQTGKLSLGTSFPASENKGMRGVNLNRCAFYLSGTAAPQESATLSKSGRVPFGVAPSRQRTRLHGFSITC